MMEWRQVADIDKSPDKPWHYTHVEIYKFSWKRPQRRNWRKLGVRNLHGMLWRPAGESLFDSVPED